MGGVRVGEGVRVDVNLMLGKGVDVGYGGCELRIRVFPRLCTIGVLGTLIFCS